MEQYKTPFCNSAARIFAVDFPKFAAQPPETMHFPNRRINHKLSS